MFKNLIILFTAAVLLTACDRPEPKYEIGNIVVSVLNNELTGQILTRRCRANRDQCVYWVRFFASIATTDVSLLSQDGPISQMPLVELMVLEMEIQLKD